MVLELNPPCMEHEGDSMGVTMSSAADLPVLPTSSTPSRCTASSCAGRLNPWYSWRLGISAPVGAALGHRRGRRRPHHARPARRRRRLVPAKPDRRRKPPPPLGRKPIHLLRRPATLPRRCDDRPGSAGVAGPVLPEKIECVLLVTPESTEFRSWYRADGLAAFDRYCDRLRTTTAFGSSTPAPGFRTSSSPTGAIPCAGAEAFTDRLGREVLQPLVEGRLPAVRSLP